MINVTTYKTLFIANDQILRVFDNYETFIESDKRHEKHQKIYTWIKLSSVN